mgnify:CR=1 FL=1
MVRLLDFFKNKNINNKFIQHLRDQKAANNDHNSDDVEQTASSPQVTGQKVMYFDNDDEFASFVFKPTRKLVVKTNNLGQEYSVAEPVLTSSYKAAEAAGTQFCVMDPKSHVNKDGMLGWEDVTLKINNVKRYK